MYKLKDFKKMVLNKYGSDIGLAEVILEDNPERYLLNSILDISIKKVDMIRLKEDISVPKLAWEFDYDRILSVLVGIMQGEIFEEVVIARLDSRYASGLVVDGPILYAKEGQMVKLIEDSREVEVYYFYEGNLHTDIYALDNSQLRKQYGRVGTLSNKIHVEHDLYASPINKAYHYIVPPSSFGSDNLYYMPILRHMMMVKVEDTWQWMDTRTFLNNTPSTYMKEVTSLKDYIGEGDAWYLI